MNQPVKITIKPPGIPLPVDTAAVLCESISSQQLLQYARELERTGNFAHWYTEAVIVEGRNSIEPISFRPDLPAFIWPENPTVLALIPHWKCESWLAGCLASLMHQTHPLTHIVVIDDGSISPPIEIVKRFPNVTMLRSQKRAGPYRLIQSVIDQTNYTAYLFQDADDWSSGDRLQTLLKTARENSAELIGSQEIRVIEPDLTLQSVGYPLNVNKALAKSPGHALLHPTSLVTRSLIQRIGGFSTGLKFGGDTEFLLRAHWAARIVNSDRYSYFRRKRSDSLTTSVETGLDSPARQMLTQAIKEQAIARKQVFLKQQKLDLSPLSVLPPIKLTHLYGPALL